MAGDISFSGLATSIDTKSIITQLMALERKPETILKSQQTTLQSQIDVFNSLNTALKSFQTVVSGMNTVATFSAKTAVSADSSVMTATTNGKAVSGTHTLVVNQLASTQRQVSASGFASDTDNNFNTGTITISDDKGGTPITVTIAEGSNSLQGIAGAINGAGGNFSATVIYDGSTGTPYRLMVSGSDTKNYTLDFSGLTTAPQTPNGTAYTNPSITQSGATYVQGGDASFTLDGIAMTRSSNEVGDALPGVTMSLLKGGSATTTFTVSNDKAAVTEKIKSFVSSYNSAMAIINQQSVYDATTQKSGVLSGDSTLMNLKSSLQNILSTAVTGVTGQYALASQVGIKTQSDGTLTIDSTKLSTALGANFNSVVDLFTHNSDKSGLTSDQYGIADQFNQLLVNVTKPYISQTYAGNGVIATRINSLKTHITDIDHQIARMEVILAKKEVNLNRQYTALETLISKLKSQGDSLLSALSSSSSNN